MERFQDKGEAIWSFLDDILVQCPSCKGPAHVRPVTAPPGGLAKLTCSSCGLSRTTPEEARGPRRCEHCKRWIPRADWKVISTAPRTRREQATCPRCRRLARSTVHWVSVGSPEDPFFGLPLHLQAPCGEEVLWAFNARHLALLAALVRATVRERGRAARARGEVVGNGTLLAKLPLWMKAAKNREAVIACLEKLRRREMTPSARRRR